MNAIHRIQGASVQSGRKEEQGNVIDENLRRVFDETLDEGVPDRFRDLLDQLKQQDRDRSKPG